MGERAEKVRLKFKDCAAEKAAKVTRSRMIIRKGVSNNTMSRIVEFRSGIRRHKYAINAALKLVSSLLV